MAKLKKRKRFNGRISLERRLEAQERASRRKTEEANNRRKFVDCLDDPETKRLAITEFTKLGLNVP